VNILKNIGKSMGTKQICFPLTYMENKKKINWNQNCFSKCICVRQKKKPLQVCNSMRVN